MRRALATGIIGAVVVIELGAIGGAMRGPQARGGVAAGLFAGAMVVGIAVAVAWAERELGTDGAPDGE